MIDKVFYYMGSFGPLILFIYSQFLLWNKYNLFFYYNIGFFLDSIINLILKGFFQQPRPSEDHVLFNIALKNGKRFIFKDYIPHDIFGMPSGHSQSTFFSTVFIYLSLQNINVFYFYLFISFITIVQRVVYDFHTIFQVIIGSIVGCLIGYTFYYFARQKIKGKIREKPDDFAPQ
jgi:membrane-associated phospholipid phosphatase